MFFFALALLVAVVIFQFSKRLSELQALVAALTARVASLERLQARATPPTIAVPAAQKPPEPARRPAAPVPVRATPPEQPRPIEPPAVAPARTAAAAVAAEKHTADRLEARIGSRWLLYIGVLAIVVGVAYFEKLALDNHWIGETARVIQGGIAGLVFVVVGQRFSRAGYRLYGQLVSGCGIAVLYVVTYAAFNLYHLVSQMPAFAVMSAITLLAAWLSDRQASQGLALVAVGGGFLTPFLLGSGTDAEVALFAYDAILIAGTMLLSRRRDWPALNVVSYAFTLLTVAGWAATFYSDSKYLTTELFLTLFCGMFLYILSTAKRSTHPAARAERAVLWTAPVLYHLASLAILGPHSTALLVYLVIVAAIGVGVSLRGGLRVRLAFWLAVAMPLLVWSDTPSRTGGWVRSGVIAWISVYLFNLVGILEAALRRERVLTLEDIALLHLNSAAAFIGMYLLLESTGAQSPALAVALALVQAVPIGLTWRRDREEALHFGSVAFSLLAIAFAQQFDAEWITTGWAAEGAGIIAAGLFGRRMWVRRAGLVLFAIAAIRLLAIQFADPLVGQMAIFNQRAALGAFVVALTYALAWMHDRLAQPDRRALETGIGLVAAKLLLLSATAAEIVAYWELHQPPPPFEPFSQLIVTGFLAGSVIMALALSRQQEWMRAIGGAVVAASAFGLFLIQAVTAPGYHAILNGRVAAGVFGVATLYVLTRLHRDRGTAVRDLPVNLAVLTTTASLLTLSLLTSEINAFWAARGAADGWSISHDSLQAIAWASIGGFLIWRGLLSRHFWVRVVGGFVLAVALVRVLLVQLSSPAVGYLVVANARVLSAIVLAVILFGLARLYQRAAEGPESRYGVATFRLIANVIGLTLLTSEITAYWRLHDLRAASASVATNSFFAREMMLSITWAVYSTILIVVGLKRRYAPIRYFAIAVFAVTIVKVFAVDLADLDRLYRVASIIGLGVLLLLTAFLYQRLRVAEAGEVTDSVP